MLSTPTVRPGDQVTGIVHMEGGDVEQEINRITVALETVVEVETDDSEFNSTQRFATQPITGGMVVRPGDRQQSRSRSPCRGRRRSRTSRAISCPA